MIVGPSPRTKLWNVCVWYKTKVRKDCILLISLMFENFRVFYGCDDSDGNGDSGGINSNEQSERKSDGINECFGKMSSKIKFNSMVSLKLWSMYVLDCNVIVMYLYTRKAFICRSPLWFFATTCVSINLCTDSTDT